MLHNVAEYNAALKRRKTSAINGVQLVKAVVPGYFGQNKKVILPIQVEASVTEIDGDRDQRQTHPTKGMSHLPLI